MSGSGEYHSKVSSVRPVDRKCQEVFLPLLSPPVGGNVKRLFCAIAFVALLCAPNSFGQAADGNVVGGIIDPSGSAIPNATIDLANVDTGVKATTKSDSLGLYRFNNQLIGTYNVTVSSTGFSTVSLKGVLVELNKTTTANVTMQVGSVSTTVDVTESRTLIDTTTPQLANNYERRLALAIPAAANPTAGGILNLSLLGAGVVSQGGFGAVSGPSVGGQRPRNNNYTVEGTDNNRKDVTYRVVFVPNDAVAEFTALQNQFSAEFGHSSGGQFNVVLRGGTNETHGSLFEYMLNRDLNALDQSFKRQGILTKQRFDQNRFGGAVGGHIIKNKLFYYGLLEYGPLGQASMPSSATFTPTAAGYQTLATLPGIFKTNLGVLQQYAAPAPVQSKTVTVGGTAIPIGILPIVGPNYQNQWDGLISIDYSISSSDQLRGRYVDNRISLIDINANLPTFFATRPITSKLASISEFHNFSASVLNELRLGYNRYNSTTPITDAKFPGLDVFPNIQFPTDLNLQIGPDTSAPQSTIQNTYQLVDNLTWIKGQHTLKFGFDGRNLNSESTFIQRVRGDYQYSSLERYLLDQVPDVVAERNVGGKPYSGNAYALYGFAQDSWKATRNLTLNLGVRYEFNSVPRSMKEFGLDSIASVPGVITFAAPQSQKHNFAPRIGFAYSPGRRANTSIRGGFGMAYDQVFDNIGLNARPPQATSTFDSPVTNTPGYLANGGILPTALGSTLNAAQARAASSAWLPALQKQGYAISWNLGVQHVFANDYSLEVRYVGTRGVHLIVQNQLNRIAVVNANNYLPTYLQAPSQATLDALPVTLTQITNERLTGGNIFAPYGFNQNITGYLPIGNSSYHALQADFNKRFSRHLLFKMGYTWSHAIDDSTAEVASTVLSPRRAQDFFNLGPEKASSLLDRRQRLTLTWISEAPWFAGDKNWWKRNVIGNYQLSGTYTAESPEWATPQSGVDSNQNGDAAADRAIVNPSGIAGTSSDVTALKNSSGATVGYLAVNPNAQFIRAQVGALANSGRNVLETRGINNWDVSVNKAISFKERYKFTLRADFLNAFNHPQYTPGPINNIGAIARTSTNYLIPGNALFGRFDQVYSSNPRQIQMSAVFNF